MSYRYTRSDGTEGRTDTIEALEAELRARLIEPDTLVLDEYVGVATNHTRIPVGRGVCGTAVAEDKNQVVADVRELTNYLACSAQTRSEIVVLIRNQGSILGQIDVDGHAVGAFGEADEAFLESVAGILAERWS